MCETYLYILESDILVIALIMIYIKARSEEQYEFLISKESGLEREAETERKTDRDR